MPGQPRIDFGDAAPFKIDGVYCKLIQLTQGHFAIVDASDHASLSQKKWLAWKSKRSQWYAARVEQGGKVLVFMHRIILGLGRSESQADHVEPMATLDNRRKNLRVATRQQNQWNRRAYRCNKTGFKGVSWHPQTKRFVARIRVGGKLHCLGYRKTAQAAYELYKSAAPKLHGEFARVA